MTATKPIKPTSASRPLERSRDILSNSGGYDSDLIALCHAIKGL